MYTGVGSLHTGGYKAGLPSLQSTNTTHVYRGRLSSYRGLQRWASKPADNKYNMYTRIDSPHTGGYNAGLPSLQSTNKTHVYRGRLSSYRELQRWASKPADNKYNTCIPGSALLIPGVTALSFQACRQQIQHMYTGVGSPHTGGYSVGPPNLQTTNPTHVYRGRLSSYRGLQGWASKPADNKSNTCIPGSALLIPGVTRLGFQACRQQIKHMYTGISSPYLGVTAQPPNLQSTNTTHV